MFVGEVDGELVGLSVVGDKVGPFVGFAVVGAGVDDEGLGSSTQSMQPFPTQSPQIILAHIWCVSSMILHLQQFTRAHCPAASVLLHLQL